ncbi:VOC family protein [Nonomuraea cavernae]|uniref:VOC family protein n=1 Tax=Nonomuraea cavernae TaxID=2045107 RepID=UPI0033F6EF20
MSASSNRLSTISVRDLETSLRFYRDIIGLQVDVATVWKGPEFEDYYALPAGASGHVAVLSSGGRPAGRIMLVEFRDAGEQAGGDHPDWFLGYTNANFYTPDMAATRRRLAGLGYEFWTDPLQYDIGGHEGAPTEVFFDGPDGLAVNLIEPQGDPSTVVGSVARKYEEVGPTPTGFSELATAAHNVPSIDDALRFYVDVVGLRVLMDFEVAGDDRNDFLRLERGSVSRNLFLYGDDLMGKIALCAPLNYVLPDIPEAAKAPPAVGHLVMAVVVDDLGATLERAAEHGVEVFAPARPIGHPGFGDCVAALVRIPGSGALMELIALA